MENLTTEDIIIMKSLLSFELLQIRKYNKYANSTQDPQLKTNYEQICAKHQEHYKALISLINT